MTVSGKRDVLIVGGGFAGFVVARHCKKHFNVTLIDAKEYFESALSARVELTLRWNPVSFTSLRKSASCVIV